MRNLHIVIPAVRPRSCASVAAEALEREPRLARLTIVAQACSVVDHRLQLEADRRSVVLHEVRLPDRIGPGRARHVGSQDGDEDFVGFLDDDIGFERGSLSALVDRCEVDGLGGASGVVASTGTNPAGRLAKAVLFRSIFRDRRPSARSARRPVPSDILSGGLTVYRRALYERWAPSSTEFPPDGCGEDVELSFSISRQARLVIDPSVRVRNRDRELSVGPADPDSCAVRYLDRYRRFAARHATTRGHWVAYAGVLLGVLARGVSLGAGAPFVRAVRAEAAHAGREIMRTRAGARALAPDR